MEKKEMQFISKDEYDRDIHQNIAGDLNGDLIHGDKNIINNITLTLPERTTKEDFIEIARNTKASLDIALLEQVVQMPGKMLMFTRDAKKLPGALIERNNRIIENYLMDQIE